MTRLYRELAELEAAGESVSVAVVGAGRMGRSLGIASEQMDGVEVSVVADIELDRARETFAAMGRDEVTTVETAADGDAALASGEAVVTEDAFLPARLDGVDVVVGATGVPAIGATVATRSIHGGKHVVMLTDEADAVVGPYLRTLAEDAGVVYAGAGGDEPGAVMELYDFARSCGFDVVAAGKGKNNPLDRTATPDSLAETAREKDLNPEIYTAFVDGTNSMLELTMVANATGLGVDTRGLHGPEVPDVASLADVFSTETGGLLAESGVVDYALGGGVAPGVFVVVTTDSETIRGDMEYLQIGDGPNYVLHKPFHIPTIEPLLTAARAEVYGDAYLVPVEPAVDTVTIAKRDLSAGEEVDGIGGRTVYGIAEDADVAREENLVPISLAEGATVTTDVERGQPLRYDDLDLVDSDLFHLRKLQDSHFG